MAAMLLKNFPPPLRAKLKKAAVLHHRSMNGEALMILEEGLSKMSRPATKLPPPVNLGFPVTADFINKAKRKGRA